MSYTPSHLKRWTMPDDYYGASWPNHFGAPVGQSRDSSALERSNFECCLKALGGESAVVTVVREGHWAVGWIEWIAIEDDGSPESEAALREADSIAEGLSDYPVINDEHFSQTEMEEANETWANCYSPSERIAYIRKHRDQFEFHDFSDLIGCVRGEYFAGYASELLV